MSDDKVQGSRKDVTWPQVAQAGMGVLALALVLATFVLLIKL